MLANRIQKTHHPARKIIYRTRGDTEGKRSYALREYGDAHGSHALLSR